MKKISLIALMLVGSIVSKAQLFFKNNTDEPVFVAIAMYYDGNGSNYWGTEGWYKVIPGEKIQVSKVIGKNDNIYYYAYSPTSNKVYKGDNSLLVHPSNKFFIQNADKAYNLKEHPNYVWKKFRHVDMNQKLLQIKYTIQLDY